MGYPCVLGCVCVVCVYMGVCVHACVCVCVCVCVYYFYQWQSRGSSNGKAQNDCLLTLQDSMHLKTFAIL